MRLLKKCLQFFIWKEEGEKREEEEEGNPVCLFSLSPTGRHAIYIYIPDCRSYGTVERERERKRRKLHMGNLWGLSLVLFYGTCVNATERDVLPTITTATTHTERAKSFFFFRGKKE